MYICMDSFSSSSCHEMGQCIVNKATELLYVLNLPNDAEFTF